MLLRPQPFRAAHAAGAAGHDASRLPRIPAPDRRRRRQRQQRRPARRQARGAPAPAAAAVRQPRDGRGRARRAGAAGLWPERQRGQQRCEQRHQRWLCHSGAGQRARGRLPSSRRPRRDPGRGRGCSSGRAGWGGCPGGRRCSCCCELCWHGLGCRHAASGLPSPARCHARRPQPPAPGPRPAARVGCAWGIECAAAAGEPLASLGTRSLGTQGLCVAARSAAWGATLSTCAPGSVRT